MSRGDLASRVAALEQAVQQLAEGIVGSEAMTPNYLTVSANGAVGAAFSGGLTLPEQQDTSGSEFQPYNSLGWRDEYNARAIVEQIIGYRQGPPGSDSSPHKLDLSSIADSTDATTISLASYPLGDAEAGSSVAQVFAKDNSGANASADILNSLGWSSFLQIASGTNLLAIAIGEGTFSFSNSNTATATITHNLGRGEQAAFGCAQSNGIVVTYVTGGLNTCEFAAYYTPGSAITANESFWWAVIG